MKRWDLWGWFKLWAASFKKWPEAPEVNQLAATRAILDRELDKAKDLENIVVCDGPLEFAVSFERHAALELIAFVKARKKSVDAAFYQADGQKWGDAAILAFWNLVDQHDPNALDPAIGGLRSMAEAMRREATQ